MRVLTYTCPWPGNLMRKASIDSIYFEAFGNAYIPHVDSGNLQSSTAKCQVNAKCIIAESISSFLFAVAAGHPKSDEYLSDPRLAAYAVPYNQAVSGYTISCPCSLLSGILSFSADDFQLAFCCATVMMQRRITCRKKLRS